MPLDQNPHQTVTRFGCVDFSMYARGFSVPQMRQICENALDGQLDSTPEPIELFMASYQGDGELVLMALHIHFLPQQQYSPVYALFSAFHPLVYL